jgi:hypothetical protein
VTARSELQQKFEAEKKFKELTVMQVRFGLPEVARHAVLCGDFACRR